MNSRAERELKAFIGSIEPADKAAIERAKRRQAELAKPIGSLGKLESIAVKLAGITGRVNNAVNACRVLVFAADNGVVDEGVAITPRSVTLAQSINMTRHITGMSSIAAYFGDSVRVFDVGIDTEGEFEGVVARRIRRGTANIRRGPAMTREEALRAIFVGIEAVEQAKADGVDIVGVGEMGIGNTTTSAAVLACLLGAPASAVAGRGGGLTDAAFENKIRVIDDALKLNNPDPEDAIDIVSKVGGLDIAAMSGAFLACAKYRIPAVVDGFISIVAALIALRLAPYAREYIFLSHSSAEKGYRLAVEAFGEEPYLLLDMRLGEGSGCPIAFRVIQAACAAMNGMATFEQAHIDDGYLDELRRKNGDLT